MAEKVLVRSLIEIVGTAAELGLELLLAGGVVDDELLLHAAAARHKARDSVTAAPLLPFRTIRTTSRFRGMAADPRCAGTQNCFPGSGDLRGLSVFSTTIERPKLTWP
jgi:hypothetical protein